MTALWLFLAVYPLALPTCAVTGTVLLVHALAPAAPDTHTTTTPTHPDPA